MAIRGQPVALTQGMSKTAEAVSTGAREGYESRGKNREVQRKKRFRSEDETWF